MQTRQRGGTRQLSRREISHSFKCRHCLCVGSARLGFMMQEPCLAPGPPRACCADEIIVGSKDDVAASEHDMAQADHGERIFSNDSAELPCARLLRDSCWYGVLQRVVAVEEALVEARAEAEAAVTARNELAVTLHARDAELAAIRDGAAAEASVAGSSVQAALDKACPARMLRQCRRPPSEACAGC